MLSDEDYCANGSEIDRESASSMPAKSSDEGSVKTKQMGRGAGKQADHLHFFTPGSGSCSQSRSDLANSAQQILSSSGITPVNMATRRRQYKKRSPKQITAQDVESKKQRRLEKNRLTAAVSRERKKVLMADLQLRVARLEKDKEDLIADLDYRSSQLKVAEEQLSNLTKTTARPGFAQQDFKSVVPKGVGPRKGAIQASSQLPLLEMPDRLLSDARLLPPSHQIQLSEPENGLGLDYDSWMGPDPTPFYTSQPYAAGKQEVHVQDSGVKQHWSSTNGSHQPWSFDLDLEHRRQARLEPDSGGPVLSLRQQDPAAILHHVANDERNHKNIVLDPQLGHNRIKILEATSPIRIVER